MYCFNVVLFGLPCSILFSYDLRGSNTLLLAMPSVKSKATLGDRAFAIAAPSLWNSLPSELRSITCATSFKAHLKTFLFRHAYTSQRFLIILLLIFIN